jgi:hypothetical protein
MAKFDKLEGDNLKQKEEYEGKIYGLEKNHIRWDPNSKPSDVCVNIYEKDPGFQSGIGVN